ncbi:nucleotidyltransferase family protein [Segatella copri]|uniref:nucleotidyltransferase family protein n=1 Tax=Segatella copri TaxID=165179 RepID=UPI00293A6E1D|nr:nucleotidyltransferase family protein [Segatella copri]MDV3106658.1 nucleotidyltransferase family protein [Segatella copri]
MIFDFLKYCLDGKDNMSNVVANIDWQQMYYFASKQAILGLCFEGIERLGREYPDELKRNPIDRNLLMTWMAKAQQIHRQNMKVNAVAGRLFSLLKKGGMRCCVLKGQGNALMYPNPYSRNPGDIDVWINASREEITEYAKCHFKLEDDIRFHHLETTMDGVPVELHFFPGIMNNPVYNARLQKWFKRNADLQCSNVVSLPDGIGEIAIPTTAFNVIYQLTHLYHHFFDEGIGMRQIIDYYVVMNDFWKVKESFSQPSRPSLPKEGSTAFPKPLSPQGTGDVTAPSRCSEPLRSKVGGASKPSPDCAGWDRRDAIGDIASDASVSSAFTTDSSVSTALDVVQRELKYLGLWKFAGAVMYVLHEVLGLSEDKMIAPMDEKRGRLLLAEILEGGNFGRHFTKYAGFTHQSMGKKYFLKIWRNMHFVRYYPAEALCEPLFRTWHFFWRLKYKN